MTLTETGITKAQSIRIKQDIQKRLGEDFQRSEIAIWMARSSHRIDKGQKSHEGGGENSRGSGSESGVICVGAEPLPPRLGSSSYPLLSVVIIDHQKREKECSQAPIY